MNLNNSEMRLPEEGAPTGAGPGTGVNASGQRSGDSRRPDRGNPEIQSVTERSQTTTRHPPTESATQGIPELTQAGLPRRRIRWTHEMNVSVLKAYFKATRNGNITGYRQQMHDYFIEQNPHLNQITQQNLADRRATIFRNNLIPSMLREQIRLSVINIENQHITQQPPQILQEAQAMQATQTTSTQIEHSDNVIHQPQTETNYQGENQAIHYPLETSTEQNEQTIETLRTIFNQAKINFMEMDEKHRPFIPKHKPNRKLHKITAMINEELLPAEITPNTNYNQIIGLIYCSAYTITQSIKPPKHNIDRSGNNQHEQQPISKKSSQKVRDTRPGWQRRLQQKIDEIRKDLGFLTGYNTNKTGRKTKDKLRKIKHRHIVHTQFDPLNHTIEQLRDTVKQKLAKYTERMRIYTKNHNRSIHNKIFQTEEKRFYSMLAKPSEITTNSSNSPDMAEIENFWKAIWSKREKHNPKPTWMDSILEEMSTNTPMATTVITQYTFDKAIRKLHNWKQPGNDKIHNYYYKYLTTVHSHLIRIFNEMLTNPNNISYGMCSGVTYLKPKVSNPTSASQFRPITCLNTGYKILTSCIAITISDHCENNKILAEEQKGCRQGTKGCKDQLIIDSIITKQAIRNKRNMYAAFIDYQKAYDSVPHSWLLEVLGIYKIDPKLIKCIATLMERWETTLYVQNEGNNITSNPIKVLRGIYQGDSLSPLLFCLALNPLSLLLKHSQYGYKLRPNADSISHCFYMDDLKLYASTKQNRYDLLKIVEMFSLDIKMKFGIDKCKMQNITKGKYTTSANFITSDCEEITPLQENEHYKYLGIKQHITIDHKKHKEDINREFVHRVNTICKSKLNGLNMAKAINTFAIPLLTYTFGIITWSGTDLNNIDMKIRTTLTRNKYHHPKASIERINIPRKLGGRGIISVKLLHERQLKKLTEYFRTKSTNSSLYREVMQADDNITPLNLKNSNNIQPTPEENLIQNWKSKPLHGKYPNMISQIYVDIARTNNWLLHSKMFAETEGFIVAIQDGVVHTKNYIKYIIQDRTITEDSCRRCGGAPETIPHLLNSCPTLLPNHYKQRHDLIGKIVYIEIIKQLQIKEPITYYYNYQPKPIIQSNRHTIYWDRSILTHNPPDTNMPNRPDMIIIDKQQKLAHIIDFAVPHDHNMQETIAKKKTKYLQLAQYIKQTQRLINVEIIAVVISSLGTVPKETTNAIEKLNLNKKIITNMQKAILIKATTIMRETLERRI